MLARLLPILAILLSLSVSGATCSNNAGRVFNGGGGSGGGGDDGGGDGTTPPRPDAPAIALFHGALTVDGAPTLVATGPTSGADKVDVHAPVALWFSESLNRNSVTTTSLQLRRVGSTGGVLASLEFYAGDRCVLLEPTSVLQVDSDYEIIATDDIHDLSGKRLDIPEGGVLASFHTAFAANGRTPKVIAAFPPAGSVDVPNDHDALILFSKPVNYATVLPAVAIEQVNNNGVVQGVGAYDPPSVARHGSRLYLYTRATASDDLDLGKRMRISVANTVEDTEFNPIRMAQPFESIWNTMSFGRPLSMNTAVGGGSNSQLNLSNLGAFPVNVQVDGNGIQVGDDLHVRLTEESSSSALLSVSGTTSTEPVSSADVAGSAHTFALSMLLDPAVPGISKISDGDLALAAFVERAGVRSTAFVDDSLRQDTIAPTLSRFGPPFGFSAGSFVTDLPEFRPYGQANEAIATVAGRLSGNSFVEHTAASPSEQRWFMGPVIEGIWPDGRFNLQDKGFDLLLTDTAGNAMFEAVRGRVSFHSFIGPDISNDQMTLEAVNARSLSPIPGAVFELEAADGTDLRDAVESLVGIETFLGLAGRAYNVTISAEGYHTATFYGLQNTICSLPLRPITGYGQAMSPDVTLENANGGEVRLANPLLLDAKERPLPDGLTDITVPFDFGFSGTDVLADRPGWFAAFFRLSSSDPFLQFALDPRVIVDPFSSSTLADAPELSMVPIDGASRDSYNADWAGAPGDPDISTSAVVQLPGLTGLASVGIGEDLSGGPGTLGSTITVLHDLTGAAADIAGVAEADLEIDLLTRAFYDDDGHATLVLKDATTSGSNTFTWVTSLPTVKVTGLDPQAIAGEDMRFFDSIGADGDSGYYLAVFDDGTTQWDVWVPASVRNNGVPVFPDLDESPLDDNLDAEWTMFVEAFHMPAGFSESGFFFTELRRDFDALARSPRKTVTQ